MNTLHKLTEADLDALIDAKIESRRDAALMAEAMQTAERARHCEGACPPCHGNCNQGRDCPARAAELRARVAADHAEAMPAHSELAAIAGVAIAATVIVSLLVGA